MKLRGAWGHEAQALAQLHAAAFDHAWSADEIAQLLDGPGGFALLVENETPLAFILCRAVAGAARMAGADVMFLEVAHDNLPALGLYEAAGFARAGLRRGYYDRGAAGSADAVVMRLDLGRAA